MDKAQLIQSVFHHVRLAFDKKAKYNSLQDIQEEEFDLAENEAVEEETPELPDIEAEKAGLQMIL